MRLRSSGEVREQSDIVSGSEPAHPGQTPTTLPLTLYVVFSSCERKLIVVWSDSCAGKRRHHVDNHGTAGQGPVETLKTLW